MKSKIQVEVKYGNKNKMKVQNNGLDKNKIK